MNVVCIYLSGHNFFLQQDEFKDFTEKAKEAHEQGTLKEFLKEWRQKGKEKTQVSRNGNHYKTFFFLWEDQHNFHFIIELDGPIII